MSFTSSISEYIRISISIFISVFLEYFVDRPWEISLLDTKATLVDHYLDRSSTDTWTRDTRRQRVRERWSERERERKKEREMEREMRE